MVIPLQQQLYEESNEITPEKALIYQKLFKKENEIDSELLITDQSNLTTSIIVLVIFGLTCFISAALCAFSCFKSKRNDGVTGGNSRWLPGVGTIDYVPPESRYVHR